MYGLWHHFAVKKKKSNSTGRPQMDMYRIISQLISQIYIRDTIECLFINWCKVCSFLLSSNYLVIWAIQEEADAKGMCNLVDAIYTVMLPPLLTCIYLSLDMWLPMKWMPCNEYSTLNTSVEMRIGILCCLEGTTNIS